MSPKEKNDRSGGWRPSKGASERDAELSEFWKPELRGDALLGRIVDVRDGAFGEYVKFSPCALQGRDDTKPVAHGEMRIALNTWLEKLISAKDMGRAVAVVFDGKRDTPKGKMRTYRVFQLDDAMFRETMTSAGVKPEGGDVEGEDEGGDDDLPF